MGIVRASHDSCNNAPVSLAGIDTLANQFEASVTSTGSRYVDSVSTPCAFVLSHKGRVINASRSKALKDANAFIERQLELPRGSVSAGTREGDTLEKGKSTRLTGSAIGSVGAYCLKRPGI